MICPNCDGILGGNNCQGCGWTKNDPWPVRRMVAGSTHPLKDLSLYPARPVELPDYPGADNLSVEATPLPPVQTLDNLAEINRANAEDGETPDPAETPAAPNAVSETPKPKLDPNIQ